MARRCIAMKVLSKIIVQYSSSIIVISLILLFIFYNYFTEVTDNSFEHKIHLYESSEQNSPDEDLENPTRYGLKKVGNLRDIIEGKCSQLYDIARDMIRGERMKIPFGTNQTRWKFHARSNLDLLNKTSLRWNYPWSLPKNLMLSKRYFKRYSKIKSKELRVKKYFITFAENCCNKSKITAINYARYPGGFDFTTVHDLDSLSKGFRRTHSFILHKRRGAGYWLWKPYIILKTLVESMAKDDLLVYQDAGAYFVADAGPLLKLCQDIKEGILVFHTRFAEKRFSKRDAFVLMGMDDTRVYKSSQRLAAFVVIRKNCKSLQFVMEWLAYASDPRISTDIGNKMGEVELSGFHDNRHDQTVLSLLSKKWGLLAFRDPSQFGEELGELIYAAGPYEQLITHTRSKN